MTSSLLLNQPLPLSAIQLGRLVRDPLHPDDDFHQPAFPAFSDNEEDGEGGTMKAPVATAAVEYKLDNLSETLNRSRGTRLEATLLNVLRLSWQVSDAQIRATVAAQRGAVRQLRSPHAYFEEACRDNDVRAWVEEQARRPQRRRRGDGGGSIYLVCGLKMLTDARVELAATQRRSVGVTFSVPVAATAGVPIPVGLGLDVGVEAAVSKESSGEAAYTATGGFVYAVQYRKIRFSRFSTRSADNAYLEKGNHWKSYLVDRAGEEDEDEDEERDDGNDDGISAEVAGPPEPSDLEGSAFESLNVDGNQIIYEVDEDDEG